MLAVNFLANVKLHWSMGFQTVNQYPVPEEIVWKATDSYCDYSAHIRSCKISIPSL